MVLYGYPNTQNSAVKTTKRDVLRHWNAARAVLKEAPARKSGCKTRAGSKQVPPPHTRNHAPFAHVPTVCLDFTGSGESMVEKHMDTNTQRLRPQGHPG